MPRPLSPPRPRANFFREFKQLCGLGIPILIAQLAQTGIGVTDTIMAGRVSAADMAAVSLGTSIWIPIFLFIIGLMSASTTISARLYGAKKHLAIGAVVRQALWLGLVVGVVAAIIIYNAHPLLDLLGASNELKSISRGYLQALAWGFPAATLFLALRCFSEGIGRTPPIMAISLMVFILNIPLNYIFIYGKLGFPAMGAVGCGWASAVTMWISLLLMLVYTLKAQAYRHAKTFKSWSWPQRRGQMEIIRLGFPMAMTIFAESSVFSLTALLIASLGAVQVAGHQVAINFASLLFMVPLSLSIALSIRVGHTLGAGDKGLAKHVALTGVLIASAFSVLNFTVLMLLPQQIAELYTSDQKVQAVAVSLLFYAALFQLSDGIQACTAGALRGYQDTKIPMVITLLSYWMISIPVGYSLGLLDWWGPPMGPGGLWIGLVVGLTVAALFLGRRLYLVANDRVVKGSVINK